MSFLDLQVPVKIRDQPLWVTGEPNRIPQRLTLHSPFAATLDRRIPPVGRIWDIRTITVQLNTTAAIADRYVRLMFYDTKIPEGSRWIWYSLGLAQTDDTFGYYSWAKGGSSARTLIHGSVPVQREALPDIYLYPDMGILIEVENQQAGDLLQASICGYQYEGEST